MIPPHAEGAPGPSLLGTGDIDTMQAMASIRIPDSSMTPLLACLFSEASGHWPISTGKERDTESGNDYFGARYYASSMGRWLSPDWSAKEEPVPYAKLENPQSLNLYAYLLNNPLSTTDPDGHGDQDDYAARIAAEAGNSAGSNLWSAKNTTMSNGQVFWSGSNKCNEFVSDTVTRAGGPTPVVLGTDKIPTASQFADPNVKIAGFSGPQPLSEAKPGDIIAQAHGTGENGNAEGHAGIVVAAPTADSPGQTASANANKGGQVTVNDWGFRSPTANPNNGERNGGLFSTTGREASPAPASPSERACAPLRMTIMKKWQKDAVVGCCLVGLGALLSFGFVVVWLNRYPQDYDPKNIQYVLWKFGLNRSMNLDHAVGGMTHDIWSVRLVEGKSKEELKNRFGFIRALNEARPYDQLCSTNGSFGERGIPAAGKEVVFLRDSDWMVILDKGKAVDLVLCKGY